MVSSVVPPAQHPIVELDGNNVSKPWQDYNVDLATLANGAVQASAPVMFGVTAITGEAGTVRGIAIATDSAVRWELIGTSDAEGGDNSGTDLWLSAFSDDGTTSVVVLRVSRMTHVVDIPAFQASGAFGFGGATPVTRPNVTGSRGNNTALGSLLIALNNMGLINNATGP